MDWRSGGRGVRAPSGWRAARLGLAILACLLSWLAPAGRGATLNARFTPLPPGSTLDLPAFGPLDWVHWGLAAASDVNRLNTASPVITNFQVLGVAPVEQTNGLAAACLWTNGTPTLDATSITGAILVRGLGNGFQLALPADPQPRRLHVALGSALAQGRFEASLSDLDGLPHIDTSLDSPLVPTNGLYTIDFAAGSTGQTLLVSFTLAAEYDPAQAVVLLQAAMFSIPPSNQPPSVVLTCPAPQASVPALDPIPLCAEALDSDGSVALVEFFADGVKLGETTQGPFSFSWSNATPGLHVLTAAVTDDLGARRVSAPVTVFVYSGLGQLLVSGATPPTAVNLTAEGLTDWAHWGLETEASFNHKAGVSQQISNYTLAGAGPAYAYFDNVEAYTWTDGTPTPSLFSYPAGVYCAGLGEGFEVRVAADTTVKTLRLYVGAYGARGRLQAWLDDYSTPVLFDQSLLNPANGPGRVYTVQFRAGAPGQSLVLRYTVAEMHDAFGNVTLQAATLVGENNPPFAALVAPTNHTVLTAPASLTLRVEASDLDGAVAKVEFFRGTTKLGETTAEPHELPVSNLPAGNPVFSARATDDEGATFTTLPVTVHVITGGGQLSGSFGGPPAQVNLSAEGALDWAHWGSASQNSFVHRQGGAWLSNVQVSGGARQRYTDNATAFSWTNGTPTLAVHGTTTGLYVRKLESGFQLTVPVDPTLRRLRFHVGLYGARGRFEAALSDFSAAPFVDDSLSNPSGNAYRVYTLYGAAASPGQTLTVRWTAAAIFDEQFGNVTWQAASVSLPDLRLLHPRWEAAGFTFSVLTEAGRIHIVEHSETLAPGSWLPVTNFLGTGAAFDVIDPGPPATNRNYRLRLP